MRKNVALAALALTGLTLTLAAIEPAAHAEEAAEGETREKAKAFSLQNLDRVKVSLDDHAGDVVLVNFWATWCAPCISELRYVNDLYNAWNDEGFVALAISIDDARSASKVKPTVKSKRWAFPVLLDTSTTVVSSYFPSKNVPYNELVSHDGYSVWSHMGYSPGDECELQTEIAKALTARNGTAPATMPLTHCP
jgi:peroxiredoxin